ncbi:MAG: replication factor C large subunit [Asgard group archaeon]|nr:replication factor C large subunit [Asgard group archaeon]
MNQYTVPWTEKYRPKNLDQVVGNDKAITSLRKWFNSWAIDQKKKAALLNGPAGIGKTSSVVALAKERGYEVVEMNASDTRNKKAILKIAGISAKEGSLETGSHTKRILLIDEVDGLHRYKDRGGVTTLVKVIKSSAVPIICTANDAYDRKLKSLRKVAKVINYQPINQEDLVKVLKQISKKEKIPLKAKDLEFIAEQAQGDLRSAINDLQGLALQLESGEVDIKHLFPKRDQTKDIDQALTALFTAKGFSEGKASLDGLSMKYDTLLLWIFENAYKYCSKDNLPQMYETLAAADRYLGRIKRRQSWHLLSYFFDFISGGVATAVDNPPRKKQRFTYPQKIAMYARTRWTRRLTDSIANQIGEKMHVSTHVASTQIIHLLREVMNSTVGDAAETAYWLELDNNQIKRLVKSKEKQKKIKKVIEAFEEERIKKQTSMDELQYSSFDRDLEDWQKTLKQWEKKKEEIKKEKEEQQKKEEAKESRKELSENQVSLEKFMN